MHIEDFLSDPVLIAAGAAEAVVWEPEHSLARLRELEARYGLDSAEADRACQRGEIPAGLDWGTVAEWAHYYEICYRICRPAGR